MSAPIRFQLSRRKGYRKPEGGVVCTRASRWGNPHKVADVFLEMLRAIPESERPKYRSIDHGNLLLEATRAAINRFSADLYAGKLRVTVDDVRRELRGKSLGCFCALPAEGQLDLCHAAILLEISNQEDDGGAEEA